MAEDITQGTPPGGGTTTSAAPPVADTRAPATDADELQELRERLKRAEKTAEEATVRADNEAQARQAATRQVADTHSARLSAEENAITTAIASAEGNIAQLQASYETAANAGDAKAMAKINFEMTRETVRLETLNGHKFNLEQAKKAPPPRVRAPSNTIDDDDPRLANFSPAIKEWVQKNSRFLTDAAFNKRVMQAHHAALGEGIAPESDDYFEYVEKKVGIREPEQREETGGDEPVLSEASRVEKSPRGSSAAAAPSRGSPANGTRHERAPNMTDEERERAEIDYDHLPNIADRYLAYAKSREELRKMGKIGTSH